MFSPMIFIAILVGLASAAFIGAAISFIYDNYEFRIIDWFILLFLVSIFIGNIKLAHIQAVSKHPDTIYEVEEHKVIMVKGSAYVPGDDTNLNRLLGVNIEEGQTVYEIKRACYWHYGYFWVGRNEFSLERPEGH